MSITLGDAILHLKADKTQLESDLQGASGGIAGWLGGTQGVIATGIATALAGAVMQGIKAAGAQETALMRLEAVHRATGGAVGMTVEQLRQLASQMMFLTGIEDENFMAAEALAMTYGNIGAEVMPRLLAVGADMATMMGTDVTESVRTVALACSAGEDGLMRLRRAGVIFTDEQKEMIKTLWAVGDIMGAQNIVLSELEGRFGGTAAAALDTYEGRLRSMKTAVGELWEGLGNLNIGGRTLIDWMTDGVTTATNIINISDRVNSAFESTRDEIAQTATSYDEYIGQTLAVAVAAGKITQGQADLYLSLMGGREALFVETRAMDVLIPTLQSLGIELNEAAWSGRDVAGGWDEGARSARNFSDAADQLSRSVTPLAAELRPLSQEYFDNRVAADAAATATERANAAWAYANALPGTITRQMFIQIQTMLSQAAWFGVEHVGGGEPSLDTSQNMGAYGPPGPEASGAGVWSAAEANEASRLRYLAWIAAGSPDSGPGGQHGLSFDVEGPSGTDQVPVNLALTRGEHVEVTPAGEQRGPQYPVTFNVYVNNRDDLQALEQSVMQIFRGV